MRLASVLLFAAVATATPPWQYLRLSIRYDVQADGSIRCTRSGQLALLTRSGVESFTNFAMPARGTVRMNRFLVAGNPRGPGSLQDGLWMVPVGAVKTGDAIDYEIEQTIRPAGGGGAFWFEDLAWSDAPASEGEIVLDLPAESKWKVQLLDKKQYTLETKGTRSIHTWKFGPATDLNRKPRFRMATFDSWQQLGNWVTQRISLETGPRIRALATSLGFERLHELVTQRIGLVGSPWAESGFQVRTAQDTLTRREGSALDKQRLIASLWKAAGIEAELAFVLTGDGDSTPNPLSLEKPLLVVMRGGETLWVDPADPSAMPGVLAGPLRGRSALIVGLRSRVEQIPREPPPGIATRNRASAEWHAVVRADGALEGSMHFEADGEIARNWRESEIRSTSRDWIAAGAQAATLRGDPAVSDPYDFTRPFSITMLTDSASLHRLAKRGSVPMQALVFHMGGPSEQRETIEIKLDGGFAATCSPGGRIERGYGTYLSKCELADGVVRIERTLRLTTAAEVDAGFRRAVLDDQQSRVAIRRRKAPEVERALSGMTVSELHAAASDLWMKQDLRTALRVYTRLTELHPMHAYYWSSVGRLQAALRNEEEARQALRKALELTPTDFSTHTQLISLEMRNGNYEGAAGQIRRLLKEKPGDRFGLGNLPTVLLRAGRYEEVETAINDLRLTEPNISSHRLTGLLALACQGKAPELAAEIEAIAPAGQPLTLLTAAARLAECGAQLPLAADCAFGAMTGLEANGPGFTNVTPIGNRYVSQAIYADALSTLGWIQHQMRQSESALGYLRAAVDLAAPPESMWRLAVVLDGSGKREEADAWFRAAVEAAPWKRASVPERLRATLDQVAPARAKGGWRAVTADTPRIPDFAGEQALFGMSLDKTGTVKEVLPATDDQALAARLLPALRSLRFPTVAVGTEPVEMFFVLLASVDEAGQVRLSYSGNSAEIHMTGLELARRFFEPPM